MKDKIDVTRPLGVVFDKVLIPWRPLLLRVACEHALQADAHAFYVVYRAPASSVEEVKAYDAVCVDVRMPWYGMRFIFHEDYFGGLKYV